MTHNIFALKSKILLCVFICFGALHSEPSAFELQSGATKKDLKKLQATNKNLESAVIDYNAKIESLEQSQDGLKSIVDGQALRIKSLIDSTNSQSTTIQTLQAKLEKQSTLIETLQQKLDSHTQTIDQLNTKINDLNALITKINDSVLTKLNALADNKSTTDSKKDKSQSPKSSSSPSLSSIKNPDKKKEAIDFARKMYREGKLNESKEIYQWLADNDYKAASSLYMVGEILYQQQKYTEAIASYKKSASLDEKASYMPILLWHTAWAFRYSKDLINYNKFLDSLIYLYPESEQGKKAKDLKNKEIKK
ncbi:hypothetical protein [Helicobacter fennelliae]|uniref:TPR repeat containing exported protein n=2 Tax=Helicobacter fennelliae TaxID=215 RepID=T1DVE2_9HELI|nr:hypothetical protein [Helicobacter fennelliae]GAD18462.1 TPR repeat containing exported protein [Helicobacter fennelliae MRY12-0050]SQB98828.1 periplasmic protein [Helicobacter fennelliae]STP08171.1 periplasmic protein [Helicobacter fennelliae]STQ83921.1 periplasmic protein [Helicobacter fennelliae]